VSADAEKIRAKHRTRVSMLEVETCEVCDQEAPCDVVRLADAIDAYLQEWDTPVPDLGLRVRLREKMRTTLREVAGGDDE
jgi:hypothetical protein